MKVIKLTLEGERKIFVNFSLVTDFSATNDHRTMICFGKEDYHFSVLETPDEIIQLLKL